jgi:hypothetical protein
VIHAREQAGGSASDSREELAIAMPDLSKRQGRVGKVLAVETVHHGTARQGQVREQVRVVLCRGDQNMFLGINI